VDLAADALVEAGQRFEPVLPAFHQRIEVRHVGAGNLQETRRVSVRRQVRVL
jgi:hypothetical protein